MFQSKATEQGPEPSYTNKFDVSRTRASVDRERYVNV